MKSKGFTYTELLLGVVFLLTVSAIAVPNFTEADLRSKVSRGRNTLRTVQVGLEAYKVDRGAYIWCSGNNWAFASAAGGPGGSVNTPTLERLTTPIAYITHKERFRDPFQPKWFNSGTTLDFKQVLPALPNNQLIWYHARNLNDSSIWGQTAAHDTDPVSYYLQVSGPDQTFDLVWQMINSMVIDSPLNRMRCLQTIYDPTNGLVSRGSLWRAGGEAAGRGISLHHVIKNDEIARKERE